MAILVSGDVGFFSLAVGKGLSTFEGGVLMARDPSMRAALRAAGAATRFSPWWELRRSIELLGYAMLYRPCGLRMAYGKPLEKSLSRGDWVEAAGDDFDDFIAQHRLGRWRQSVGAKALRRLAAFQRQTSAQAGLRIAQLQAERAQAARQAAQQARQQAALARQQEAQERHQACLDNRSRLQKLAGMAGLDDSCAAP